MQMEYIPATTLTDEYVSPFPTSVLVKWLYFVNTHTATVSVSVADGQGMEYAYQEPIDAGKSGRIPLPDGGLWFKNGIKWKASVTAVVRAWVQAEQVR